MKCEVNGELLRVDVEPWGDRKPWADVTVALSVSMSLALARQLQALERGHSAGDVKLTFVASDANEVET